MPNPISFSYGTSAQHAVFEICRQLNFHYPYIHRVNGNTEITFKFEKCPDNKTAFSLLLRLFERCGRSLESVECLKTPYKITEKIKLESCEQNATKEVNESIFKSSSSSQIDTHKSDLNNNGKRSEDSLQNEIITSKNNCADQINETRTAIKSDANEVLNEHKSRLETSNITTTKPQITNCNDQINLDSSVDVSDQEVLLNFRQTFHLSSDPHRYKQPFISYLNEYSRTEHAESRGLSTKVIYTFDENNDKIVTCRLSKFAGNATGVSKKDAKSKAACEIMRKLLSHETGPLEIAQAFDSKKSVGNFEDINKNKSV